MNKQLKVSRIEGRVMKVNSYVVEHPSGVLVVDGMLTVSDARAVRRYIDELGRPVLGALVTHAHPDHYAGFDEMLRGLDVSLYATPHVRAIVERDDPIKDAIVGPMLGAEWPEQRRFPSHDLSSGGTLSLAQGELSLQVLDLGAAESPADSLWKLDERSWFVGDLGYSRMHAYLADGYHAEWRQALQRLEREIEPDATLYVGGGPPGLASELLRARYVETFVESVARHRSLDKPDLQRAVMADLKRALPSEDLAFLAELSIEPPVRRLH